MWRDKLFFETTCIDDNQFVFVFFKNGFVPAKLFVTNDNRV